ncbi:hypothetical protein SADUNF_Sadunf15G0021300 [Salix dunnii]|uniref:Hexosyltransferase n=1 Tax=Salix dunnii TaxID=1413687 RepID=A0A835JDK0_9ROSI|nr:hypothetical protein SADUNF_Sadunf15G0021300 [Salix dunnii]
MLGGSKGFNTNRASSSLVSGSRIYTLLFSMFATFASVYVSGRLWQESQNRVYLIKELDRITGQGQSAISVDDTLKIIACREQQKKLSALETELAAAKQEGFTSKVLTENDGAHAKKRHLVVIGIMTRFGNKNNRDAVRKAWMGTGRILWSHGFAFVHIGSVRFCLLRKASNRCFPIRSTVPLQNNSGYSLASDCISAMLKKMENEKGIVARFVIGKSANPGDNMDRGIDNENRQSNDFIILDDLVEGTEDLPKKARLFFTYAAERWDAEFYAKVNDNIYVTIDALGTALAAHFDKPRAYIGCMKSGQVYSEPSHKWYEPDWWKFGDKKSYFRHASGEMYVISRALAKFVSINRSILRTYAHDDVSAGSWFLGLDVLHVDEGKFCCSSWTSGLSPLSLPPSLSLSHTHTHTMLPRQWLVSHERFVLGFDLFPELEDANKNRLTYGVAIAAGLSSLKVNVIEGVIFLNSLSGILCLSGFDRLLDRRLGGPTQTGHINYTSW